MYILDQEKALKAGCNVPYAGIFRGEPAEIVKAGTGTSVWIKLPEYSKPEELFNVDITHLIEVKE